MTAPLAEPPLEQWRDLIDWYGGLLGRGGRVAVRAGVLIVRGPHWLLTPPIMTALRQYEPVLVQLLLRADRPDVAWRVVAMAEQLAREPRSWNLKARPAATNTPGACRSCGERLSTAVTTPAVGVRCADCTRALQLVLRRMREGDLG